jgi:putative endonuclease
MKGHRQKLGKWGEGEAASFLCARGYTILEYNARTPYGEIDLVARKDCASCGVPQAQPTIAEFVTVFVEVKTRSSTAYGLPEDSVTPRKQAHLLAAAEAYLQAHPELQGDWQIDVIAVQRQPADRKPVITHFENAVH